MSKALGTGIGGQLSFKDIVISHDILGKPIVHLLKDTFSHIKIHLSVSDEEQQVIAFAVSTYQTTK